VSGAVQAGRQTGRPDGPVVPSDSTRGDRSGGPDAHAADTDVITSAELADDRLQMLLVEYVAGGVITRTAFMEMAAANDWSYEDRGGVLIAFDDHQRLAAAAYARGTDVDDLRPERIPTTPCATCGAAPVGTFHEGSPRYTCGPHSPIMERSGHE
jgi:hypothetical protein